MQSHANDAVNKVLDAMGLHITHWDGVAVLEAESYEKIFEVRLIIPIRRANNMNAIGIGAQE